MWGLAAHVHNLAPTEVFIICITQESDMDPLQVVFLVISTFIIVYNTVAKPRIDGFSLAAAAMIFYFSPSLLQTGSGIMGPFAIPPEAAALGTAVLAGLVVFDKAGWLRIKFAPASGESGRTAQRRFATTAQVLTLLCLALFTVTILQYDLSSIGQAKAQIDPVPFIGPLFRVIAPLAVVSNVLLSRHRYTAALLLVLVVHLVLFQVRSTLLFTGASVGLYLLRQFEPTIRQRVAIGVGGASFTGVFILFDNVKRAVLTGNWSILTNQKVYLDIFLNNNAHIFINLLQVVVETGVRSERPAEYLARNTFATLPLTATLVGIDDVLFGNEIIVPMFFPSRSGGVTGNIWAEALWLGGVPVLLLALTVYFLGLSVLSANLSSDSRTSQLFAYTFVPYWAAYYPVLSSASFFGTYLSNFLIVLVGTYVIAHVITTLTRLRTSADQSPSSQNTFS